MPMTEDSGTVLLTLPTRAAKSPDAIASAVKPGPSCEKTFSICP